LLGYKPKKRVMAIRAATRFLDFALSYKWRQL
jgi:hypothetical protein